MRRLTMLLAVVGALMLVPAASAFAAGTMTVQVEGTGNGEVVSTPFSVQQLACAYTSPGPATGICKTGLDGEPGLEGIEMEALAAPGSEFGGWVKLDSDFEERTACEHPNDISNFTYCAAYEGEELEPEWKATAIFCTEGSALITGELVKGSLVYTFEGCAKTPTTLQIAKTGEGTVVSKPGGIECTGAKTGAECQHSYSLNSTVTLTASPATGYAFSAWAGCTTHVGLTCTVEMSKAKTVKASFVATPSLTIQKTGTGQGKVGATGISCDENCSKASSAVKTGTSVTVKVAPAKGSKPAVFEGGTGSASSCSGETCTFTISENSSVKVKFDAIPTKALTVNLTGPAKYKGKVTGKGTVKGLTASAINCGAGCTSQTESFFSTDEVTLNAVAGTGYTFVEWSGGVCSGTNPTCVVPMGENRTVTALFK